MNIPKTPVLCVAMCASLFAIGTPSFAAEGNATLEGAVAELRTVPPDRGEWTNRYMPHGTGRYSAASADEILTATLRIYTRQVLDRGGWVNAFVSNPGYDAGNPLLAVRAGEGVTTAASSIHFQAPQVLALASSPKADPGESAVGEGQRSGTSTKRQAPANRGQLPSSASRPDQGNERQQQRRQRTFEGPQDHGEANPLI